MKEKKLVKRLFKDYKVQFFTLSNMKKKPISFSYNSKLGEDRLGLALGGFFCYGPSVLIIDLGTCITYDFLLNRKYEGGQISPGLQTRVKSLYNATKTLPKVKFVLPNNFIGKSTEDCICSGVFFGMLMEIKSIIKMYRKNFPKLKVVITGGDSKIFNKHIKNVIFDENLLMKGLNCMLDENIKT